jgi:AraC-like DNA-binding protein
MDPRIEWALEHMRAHLRQPLDVATLARHVNLSPSRFAHLFRANTGVAPVRYLRGMRLSRARLLLERTFLSVKEVMALVGCNDASHFTRDYRRAYGMAPQQWRATYGVGRREPADVPAAGETSARLSDSSSRLSEAAADSAYVRQQSPTSRRRAREPGSISY